jgi:hypothetical protein
MPSNASKLMVELCPSSSNENNLRQGKKKSFTVDLSQVSSNENNVRQGKKKKLLGVPFPGELK